MTELKVLLKHSPIKSPPDYNHRLNLKWLQSITPTNYNQAFQASYHHRLNLKWLQSITPTNYNQSPQPTTINHSN